LIAAGLLLALWGALEWVGWRRCADVLDMIEPPRVAMPMRCTCTGRRSFCDCAIDGVRNPRGAGRGRNIFKPGERAGWPRTEPRWIDTPHGGLLFMPLDAGGGP
jgi:hypothetical protein